ncbi:heme biosynthesis HemY N-terminal domain-containing protein [Tolumonas lignilytica]|uniref:heme biosynthesis HemY N-terminal domain-containing protein n=1 Tax=Tolumonas lignilytica TaxID=1283284 RepID=UPI0004647D35|nr:heme biosynthesis HemY N-terminal domain-containing protein [Tolumonas lignilytica]
MIRLILLLVILAAALLLGPQLADHQGYVMIAIAGYTIEMSVVTATLLAFVFYLVLLLTENVLTRLFSVRRGLRGWWQNRRYLKAQRQTQKGMTALAEGEYQRAEHLMLRSAEKSDLPLLNYLSAAEAAHAQSEYQKRDDYLQKAAELDPQAQLAIQLTQVRLLQDQGEWQRSRELLEQLRLRWPHHPQILQRLYRIYQSQQAWQEELELLPLLRKQQLLTEEEFIAAQEKNFRAQFDKILEEQTADALLAFWQHQSRLIRHTPQLQLALIDSLIQHHQDQTAAEQLLPRLRKQANEALWQRCANLKLEDASALLQLLLRQLKQHPQSAVLLSALGHLYYHQEQYVLAQGYLERSIALQPSAKDQRTLAAILEQLRLFEKAAEYYRLSLS